jgi:uncharacterized protein (TIRG00374 family)
MLVHLSLLGLVLATGSAGEFHLGWHAAQGWVLWGVVALCAVALLVRPLRRKLTSFGRNLLVSLKHYEQQPHKLAYAALALLSLTLLNVAVLYLAARSFGVWLDLPALFVVYTAGVFVGAAVPTPGGLAGVEAGLVGGCMAYGVTSTTAIAIALAFRLVTYWFPLAPALLALYTSRRLRLI